MLQPPWRLMKNLIDLDPQGNATMGSGVDKFEVAGTSYEPCEDQPAKPSEGKYDVIPANADVTAAEIKLMEHLPVNPSATSPRKRKKYDYIFIDCPPSLNLLT